MFIVKIQGEYVVSCGDASESLTISNAELVAHTPKSVEISNIPEGIALIPTMTSDTTPSGKCFDDYHYSEANRAFYMFDGNDSTYLHSIVGKSAGYTFDRKVRVRGLSLLCLYRGALEFKTAILQASNDEFISDINDIQTIELNNTEQSSPTKFTINNNVAYKSYRIKFTSTYNAQNLISVRTMQLYS